MQPFTLEASDGAAVACYGWPLDAPRAVIHIAHGMGEHAQRYAPLALALQAGGYAVYANDHRGHGATATEQYGDLGGDGWNRVLADAYELNRLIAQRHPQAPIVLLGHSMGAMMAQLYVTRYGRSIDALVLSGSPGFKAPAANLLALLMVRLECWRLGPQQHSPLLQRLLFGANNKAFAAADATGFEWLSSDAAAVRHYVDDAACGFVLANGSLRDLFTGAADNIRPEVLARMPADLPVYVLAGTADPVHGGQRDLQRMLDTYAARGLAQVEMRWYVDGRHEMFNETNRVQVVNDLMAWLGRL